VQAEGALLAVGRADDQVRIEGTPVHPSRIAAHLRRSPGVDDAMVVPVVDPWGTTRLVAFVVSDIPAAALAPELTRSLRAALDGPERPHRVVVRRELPRGALGAPDLAALARLAEHALGGPDAPTPDSNAD
jgi:acyl-coenzyme A synthetase/AMP-(fatty) acid ligase